LGLRGYLASRPVTSPSEALPPLAPRRGSPRRDAWHASLWVLQGLLERRFLAKALPDADLRSFSNAKACFSSVNAMYVFIAQGEYFEVCDTSPALCFCKRARKSLVDPT